MSAKEEQVHLHQCVTYTLTDLPKVYGPVGEVRACFLCVSKVNEFVEPEPAQIEKKVTQLNAWAARFNYPETWTEKYEKMTRIGAAMSLYLAPTMKSDCPRVLASAKFITWVMTMGDILDDLMLRSSDLEPNTYQNLAEDAHVFVDILDGKLKENGLPNPRSTMRNFRVMLDVTRDVYIALVQSVPNYGKPQERKYFIRAVRDFFQGSFWRYRRSDGGKQLSLDSYMFFRRHHGTCTLLLEFLLLVHGLKCSELEQVREDLEFEYVRAAYASAMSVTNDVVGLRKEIIDGETENLAILKHLVAGTPIRVAVKESIAYVNMEVNEVGVYCQRLLERNPGNKQLRKLVEIIKLSLDGHLFWCGYTKRYGDLQQEVQVISEAQYKEILYPRPEQNSGA